MTGDFHAVHSHLKNYFSIISLCICYASSPRICYIYIYRYSIYKGRNSPLPADTQAAGCFKCDKFRCNLCNNFLVDSEIFSSAQTFKTYMVRQKLSYNFTNVIYLVHCKKCNLRYVGSTTTEFKVRFIQGKKYTREETARYRQIHRQRAASNAISSDAIFVTIFSSTPKFSLVPKLLKHIWLDKNFRIILQTSFIWFIARNAISDMLDPPLLNSKLDLGITNQL